MRIKLSKTFYYRLSESDNLESLSKDYNCDITNIKRNDPSNTVYPGEWVYIKQNEFISHYVKPTETLASIATKYNVDINVLRKDNTLNNDKLFIGQRIKIFES
ncbi:MAG: LysM peptidoglycan-binding domain-containing protein [Clostridia bacterium]|nr:LysM peptidoglycan-binding domain-containing protein [Clostridia bacterium]